MQHAWLCSTNVVLLKLRLHTLMNYRLSLVNKQVVLAEYASGLSSESHFALKVEKIDGCNDGKVIVRNYYLSADPAQRYLGSGYTRISDHLWTHCEAGRESDFCRFRQSRGLFE